MAEIWSEETTMCLAIAAQDVLDMQDDGVLAQAAEIAAELDRQLDEIESNVAKLHAAAWIAERLHGSIETHCKALVAMANSNKDIDEDEDDG